jgi:uncharacterized damage-inducible protein DinB
MANTAKRPLNSEYPVYYHTYIGKVNTDDLLIALEVGLTQIETFVSTLTEEQANYRYAPGKWSIKELLVHLMDAERIFGYRALRFARNDKTELSGFDENQYVPESNAESRSLTNIMTEYKAVRQATIEFYKNITDQMLDRSGRANGNEISVRALGYTIAGHEIHHMQVIKERYLTRN